MQSEAEGQAMLVNVSSQASGPQVDLVLHVLPPPVGSVELARTPVPPIAHSEPDAQDTAVAVSNPPIVTGCQALAPPAGLVVQLTVPDPPPNMPRQKMSDGHDRFDIASFCPRFVTVQAVVGLAEV